MERRKVTIVGNEAEAYDGPSLIIAYSHCIAHGINMRTAMDNQKAAVQSGHWPMYRYNPDLSKVGKNPLQLDSKKDQDRSGRGKTPLESSTARRRGALDLLRATCRHSVQPD